MPLTPAHFKAVDTSPRSPLMNNMRFLCLLDQGVFARYLERNRAGHHRGGIGCRWAFAGWRRLDLREATHPACRDRRADADFGSGHREVSWVQAVIPRAAGPWSAGAPESPGASFDSRICHDPIACGARWPWSTSGFDRCRQPGPMRALAVAPTSGVLASRIGLMGRGLSRPRPG